jgi:hypothetical protein
LSIPIPSFMDIREKRIIFRLKRFWEGQVGDKYIKNLDLWKEIASGRKTSEWRDASEYWSKRLYAPIPSPFPNQLVRIPKKFDIIWFTCGYPKNNLPRIEADHVSTTLHHDTQQYEIAFTNVTEAIGGVGY